MSAPAVSSEIPQPMEACASQRSHLFEPLYRGDSSRSRETGGAGLGLTMAHRIFLAHGGTLTAANGASGGALFTATVPSRVTT